VKRALKIIIMKTHKDLEAWKNSINLITRVYQTTRNFPKEELYGLTNQMRRSAVSIASNIAEGAARKTTKEFIHFLHIARGSLAELETQLIVCQNLSLITVETFKEYENEMKIIGAQLSGLLRSLKES
jgi:four helix bundle protein